MKTVVAIRHVPFEDLGSFSDVLQQQGYQIRYVEAGQDDLAAVDALESDLLVLLGGPIGAYEEDLYPFIREELQLLERRLAADRPLLGICLGAQLMARALGARVYPGGNGKEIGWSPLKLSEAAQGTAFEHLAPSLTQVLHWHGDTFDLPPGATLMASTVKYPHQAYVHGRALALQFHPEVTVRGMERWFIGHACEIGNTPGISVPQLRADTARWGSGLEQQGRQFFHAWLDNVGG